MNEPNRPVTTTAKPPTPTPSQFSAGPPKAAPQAKLPETKPQVVPTQAAPRKVRFELDVPKARSVFVGGENYGQGSSREHAALAPRFLGLQSVLAKTFARIHWQNLINFGILPLQFVNPADWNKISQDDVLVIEGVRDALQKGNRVQVRNKTKNQSYEAEHSMSSRQVDSVLAGALINSVGRQK